MHGYAASGLTPGVHRGLPGRSLTLVLAIDEPLAVAPTHAAWTAGVLQRQWSTLGGLHAEPAYVVQGERWAGVQLDLHPLGARRLLGVPASALPLDEYDARDLLGRAEVRLHERLQAAPSWDARYSVVVGFLLDRLAATDDRPRVRREVVEAWRWLGARRGAGTVTDLSDHLGIGRRRLAQLFGGEVGVTPKTTARLMRFDAARRVVGDRVRAGEGLDLTGVAVDHGYYDHAHLVRDFTAFTGLSPTAWVQAEVANIQAAADVDGASWPA